MELEIQQFMNEWEREAKGTVALLESLPADQYDFRPDPLGRSLGEMAWHLAEVEGFTTFGIERRSFVFASPPPNMARPKTVAALAAAFLTVHRDAVARVGRLEDLSMEITYADGTPWSIRQLLWQKMLLHLVHHRGQLMLLSRMAGGVPPALFGRTREETPRKVAPSASHERAAT